MWNALAEAETECALLPKMGVVEVLVMEDVDDLIFGATRVVIEVSDGKNRNLVRM